jgi:hypothetical protein
VSQTVAEFGVTDKDLPGNGAEQGANSGRGWTRRSIKPRAGKLRGGYAARATSSTERKQRRKNGARGGSRTLGRIDTA